MDQDIKIKIMKITTPIEVFNKKNEQAHVGNYFDFNRFDYCIKEVMKKNETERVKTYKKTETFYLENYNSNFNEEYAVGNFVSLTHGFISNSMNVKNLQITNQISEDEGLKNKVSFMIDKKSGYLYITDDKLNVININRIRNYFFVKKPIRMKYIKKFNEFNQQAFIDENYNKLYRVELLEPLPFLEKIENLKTVKSIILNPATSKQTASHTKNLIPSMQEDLREYNIGMYETEIKLKNFKNSKLSKEMKSLINYLATSQKYTDVAVEGVTKNELSRKITEDSTTRDFYIKVSVDTNGFPRDQEFFKEIINYITEDTQLNVDNSVYESIKCINL